MSPTNLAPLTLVVTTNPGSYERNSIRSTSQRSSGSETQVANDPQIRQRTGTWNTTAANHRMEEDPHDFYLGDIYAGVHSPFDCFLSTQAEQEEPTGPYLSHIRNISSGWHHLRYLADFMAVSTVPLRYKELTPEMRLERLNRVNISVLEYGSEIKVRPTLESVEQLDEFLKELETSPKEPEGRLLIVQDLSSSMIERLGAAFDIEPGFFRSHIGDYTWLNTRDPQAELPALEVFSSKSSYFNVQYVQPRYFENQASLKRAKAQAESFNVLRRIDHDGRFRPWADMPGSDVGLTRCKASLWTRPNTSSDQSWLGILLVDPQITEGFSLWSGYGNFHPPPSLHTPLTDISFPPYGTAVQEFIYWTTNQSHSKSNVPPPSPDLLPLALFTMICAQWLLMAEYINTRLGQIEWEIELGLSNFYSPDFDHTLKCLLKWRRRLPIYRDFISHAITKLSERYQTTSKTTPFSSWDDVLTNLRGILNRIETLHCRADKIMNVSMAVTGREESKKATQESHAITRVSYLAFIFVPLSFVASFFGMSNTFPVKTIWVYFASALPVSACALGYLIFAGKIKRVLHQMGERRKRWKEKRSFKRRGIV